jgi:glutathione reductase (NADPH)
MSFDVDLFVIGGGSGGVRAARVAAQHGARVAIAEASRWGGTCVVRGCVPKKLLVYASEVSAAIADAGGFGWSIDGVRFDWPAMIAAKDAEIARLSAIYRANLERAGVAVHEAHATLVGPHAIALRDAAGAALGTISAAHVLIATGGRARRPLVPGRELAITSDEAFHLPRLPGRVLVLGGGYIAIEFAHIFAGLGVDVVVAHRGSQVLPGFDDDVRAHVTAGLGKRGIALRTATEVTAIARRGDGVRVELADGGAHIDADVVMSAIGRDPASAGLGLVEQGVALGPRGAVVVDDFSRTNLAHVHAVGDVTARVSLTPVAIREGHAFADTVFGGRPTPFRHSLIPTAVFAQPPAAAIGLTETAARALGAEIDIFRSDFRPLRHTLSGRDERTMIKMIVDRATRRVLGLHMVGADAAEIIQAAAVAITMGATKDDFDRTVALHPTAAEELVLLR